MSIPIKPERQDLVLIIIAASNLEVLKVRTMKSEKMEFIARYSKKLLFKVKTGIAFEHCENLKTITTYLNRNIEISEVC